MVGIKRTRKRKLLFKKRLVKVAALAVGKIVYVRLVLNLPVAQIRRTLVPLNDGPHIRELPHPPLRGR